MQCRSLLVASFSAQRIGVLFQALSWWLAVDKVYMVQLHVRALLYFIDTLPSLSIPVILGSKAPFCIRFIAGIALSNPPNGTDARLFC